MGTKKPLAREAVGSRRGGPPRSLPGAREAGNSLPSSVAAESGGIMLDLFPDTAAIDEGGALTIGGVPAAALAREFGTPLLVYDEATIRADARAYREAAPEAFVCFGTKAFPNVGVLRILHEEGIGADVSTLGELEFAVAAGIGGDRLVVHGNNKSDEELAA